MTERVSIRASSGLVFDALTAGPRLGELVVLLHGFPQSKHAWQHQIAALAEAGYCAVAPDQRGYSRNARPDPRRLEHYAYDRLVDDVLGIVEGCGRGNDRFHLVGHDWGGHVAWGVAARHAERVASLTVLSRPHPAAFAIALDAADGEQRFRSRHHQAFLDPGTAAVFLENGCSRLRLRFEEAAVPRATIDEYVQVLGTADAMEAALAWYRANIGLVADIGPIGVPTVYVWGDADATVSRSAAEGTGDFVTGPYRFSVLPNAGHFLTDEVPQEVGRSMIEHARRHPGQTGRR